MANINLIIFHTLNSKEGKLFYNISKGTFYILINNFFITFSHILIEKTQLFKPSVAKHPKYIFLRTF